MSISLPFAINVYFLVLMFLMGACAGSFLNCAADRYREHTSVLRGRSVCPACGRKLGLLDLIPIFSYLFLRGRCRTCGAKIPIRCLFTEVAGGALYFCTALVYGFSLATLQYLLLFSALYAVALIDFDTMEIPDGLLMFGLLVFAAFLPSYEDAEDRLVEGVFGALALGGGMLVISLLMDFALGKESLGGGDVKLFALLGLFTGLAKGLMLIILACVTGLLFALTARKNQNKEFPFGPAIVIAAIVTLLLGQPVIQLYQSAFL